MISHTAVTVTFWEFGGNLLENDDAVQGLWEHRRAPSTQPSGFMEGFREEGPLN